MDERLKLILFVGGALLFFVVVGIIAVIYYLNMFSNTTNQLNELASKLNSTNRGTGLGSPISNYATNSTSKHEGSENEDYEEGSRDTTLNSSSSSSYSDNEEYHDYEDTYWSDENEGEYENGYEEPTPMLDNLSKLASKGEMLRCHNSLFGIEEVEYFYYDNKTEESLWIVSEYNDTTDEGEIYTNYDVEVYTLIGQNKIEDRSYTNLDLLKNVSDFDLNTDCDWMIISNDLEEGSRGDLETYLEEEIDYTECQPVPYNATLFKVNGKICSDEDI